MTQYNLEELRMLNQVLLALFIVAFSSRFCSIKRLYHAKKAQIHTGNATFK